MEPLGGEAEAAKEPHQDEDGADRDAHAHGISALRSGNNRIRPSTASTVTSSIE